MGLLVDTDASKMVFDERIVPRGHIRDLKPRSTPIIVNVAGGNQLRGTATGILHCTIKDKHGQ